MARHLIRHATTGEMTIVGDGALPFFPGWVVLDSLEDGQPPFTYFTGGESDLRFVNVTELSDPESPASVALRAAFGQGFRLRLRNVFGFIGDSITIGGDSETGRGVSWPAYASVMSGQQIQYGVNAGVNGQTTAQMLARLQADVIDKGVGSCAILGGANDIQTGVSFAIFMANITAMADLLDAAGVACVLCTIPPNNTDPAFKPRIVQFNAWLRRFAAARGYTLLDFYGGLADPATGDYRAGATVDGVHPTDGGYRVMADIAVTALAGRLPANGVALAQDNVDSNNLATNGLALTDTNADGVADNWKPYNDTLPSGAAMSLVTDAAVPGKLQRLTLTATSAQAGIGYTKTGLEAAGGHLIAIGGRITKSDALTLNLSAICYGGATTPIYRPLNNTAGALTRGVFYQEIAMPAGASVIDISAVVDPGTGTLDIGQLTIRDLTALSLA